MKKSIIFSLVVILSVTSSMASQWPEDKQSSNNSSPTPSIQNTSYRTAIGIRAIGTSGLTIKHFTYSGKAIEGILGFWPNAFSATALLEKHVNAFDEPGLNWYYGLGGHLASHSEWVEGQPLGYNRTRGGNLGLGVDGIFGIEYKIHEIPIAISMDVKPFIEVSTNGNAFLALDPGLGIKVTF